MRHKGKIAGSAAAMAVAVTLLNDFEGKKLVAYKDIVGVWTVCQGETRGVREGDKYTSAQCDALLAKGIAEFEAGLDRCLLVEVPVKAKIAFVSWTYNVGVDAACKSTLVRKANAGDLKGACEQLPRWNRAGGRVVRGLTNRRVVERGLCLSALDTPELKTTVPAKACHPVWKFFGACK